MAVDRLARLTTAVWCLLATAACNPVLGPSKPDANWQVVETAHFNLHARPGTFAAQNAAALGVVLDDQYEATLGALQASYGARVNGFLYNNAADAGRESEYSGIAFPDTAAFSATATPPLDASLYSLMAHEANHVVIAGALGRAGTSMMNEGLASAVISERHHRQGKTFYYTWTRTHRSQIPAMARLTDDGEWGNVPSNVAYSASASFLAYLLETGGPARLRQLYYARSGEFTARFAEIYGQPLATVEGAWLAFCDRFQG